MKTKLIAIIVATVSFLSAVSALAVTVEVHESSIGMGNVSWSESALTNGKISLSMSASAAEKCSFAGWLVDGENPKWEVDARNPSLSGIEVATNASVTATFVTWAEDTLSFDVEADLAEFVCGEPVAIPLSIESESFPTLAISGLPAGLSLDARTLTVLGTPTTPCVNTVVVKGVNESGYRFSQTLLSSVSDVSSERLSAQESDEFVAGEYVSMEFEDLFQCNGERVSTELTGLPAELEWRDSWNLVFGTPKTPGTYVVKASVRFSDGSVETATARVVVVSPDPSEYSMDFSVLDALNVGDRLESGECEIGRNGGGFSIASVTGLPKGLSLETWTEDDEKVWGVTGIVREAGLFTVRFVVRDMSGDAASAVMIETLSCVYDTPNVFLEVSMDASSPGGSGTVSGGGVMPVVADATVKAVPSRGFVFAGWFDADGEIADVGAGVDFREPAISFSADLNSDVMKLNGRFVPEQDDYMLWFEDLDGETFVFSADETLDEAFAVRSQSLPVLKGSGLPAGVSIVPGEIGSHHLVYDAETAAKRPSPGRYSATISAVNRSGAKGSASFMVVVENIHSERIDVKDDYGEFVPGEEIEPIDLSGAVDFASGETLSVSGLPRGLAYNKTANEKKGIAANTITGTPTQPGSYTLTFTAKVKVESKFETETATAFLTVLPWPTISVAIDEEALSSGCKVSGAGSYKVGSKVTLKATPAKGWVFAGWEGIDGDTPFAFLSTSLPLVTGNEDTLFGARFVRVQDDWLDVYEPDVTENGFDAEFRVGEEIGGTGRATLVAGLVGTVSLPTVSVSGLPPGVKFNAKTCLLSGKPTKTGVFYATVSAKNAGGYSFVRVLRLAVADSQGVLSQEDELPNAANIDFSALDDLITGVFCQGDDVVIDVGERLSDGAEVRKVAVSGVPAGLKAVVSVEDGVGVIGFEGTPSKPGRFTLSVTVTYVDGKTAKSQYAFNVADGGSYYLSVESVDETKGTVSGSGVYSSGATVKIAAKAAKQCVFTGWLDYPDGDPFFSMMDTDGIDYRTASASFPFHPGDFFGDCAVYASFANSEDDTQSEIYFEDAVWEIDPEFPSQFEFGVESLSLPVLTVKNLPKGVTVDLARRCFAYVPNTAVQPGIYAVSVSAQNKSKAKSTGGFEIRVANRESDVISGLDPSMDAYPLSVGVSLVPDLVAPEVEEGWKIAVKGLPSGLSYKNGVVSGVPTKAGDFTVTFTATKKGEQAQTATIIMRVDSLPEWATGEFNGLVGNGERGTVTLTVAANGKISGKILEGGRTWTLSAASFDAVEGLESEVGSPVFHATVIGKAGKEVVTNEVTMSATEVELPGGSGLCGVVHGNSLPSSLFPLPSSLSWTAWQNLWKTEPWKTVAKSFAKKTILLSGVADGLPSDSDTVTLKLSASGTATASAKFVTGYDATGKAITYSATCSSVLILTSPLDAERCSLTAILYFPPKKDKFDGYVAAIEICP